MRQEVPDCEMQKPCLEADVRHFVPFFETYKQFSKKKRKRKAFALTKNVLSRTKIKASKIPIEQISGRAAAANTDLVGGRFSSVGEYLLFIVFVETFNL